MGRYFGRKLVVYELRRSERTLIETACTDEPVQQVSDPALTARGIVYLRVSIPAVANALKEIRARFIASADGATRDSEPLQSVHLAAAGATLYTTEATARGQSNFDWAIVQRHLGDSR